MKEFVDNKVYHMYFDSLGEFFELTDPKNSPRVSTMHSDNKDEISNVSEEHSDWMYGDEKCLSEYKKKRFDRKKGYDMCHEEVKKSVASKEYKKMVHMARTYRKKIIFEDHGYRVNVAKAISGEDKYFASYKNASRPVAKIAINICGSAIVNQDTFRKLAATAIPTIFALEQAGIATEVWFVSFSTGTHSIDHTAVHVKIKSAQERFNWTYFAPVFTLGSYRHSIFTAWIHSEYKISSGYGRPMVENVIKSFENFGYTSVIGLNGVGPVKEISTVFDTLFKHSKKSLPKKKSVKIL